MGKDFIGTLVPTPVGLQHETREATRPFTLPSTSMETDVSFSVALSLSLSLFLSLSLSLSLSRSLSLFWCIASASLDHWDLLWAGRKATFF